MASFLNERTAEYALVPILQRYLSQEFRSATPVFFWRTREGSQWASKLHKARRIRVIAMFARRPKQSSISGVVCGKVNSEICVFADKARGIGIPTILGFPAVRDIFELYASDRHYWLELSRKAEGDIEFHVDLRRGTFASHERKGTDLHLLAMPQIADLIRLHARVFDWDEAMAMIGKLRMKKYSDGLYFPLAWFGGYKPVYFLIED